MHPAEVHLTIKLKPLDQLQDRIGMSMKVEPNSYLTCWAITQDALIWLRVICITITILLTVFTVGHEKQKAHGIPSLLTRILLTAFMEPTMIQKALSGQAKYGFMSVVNEQGMSSQNHKLNCNFHDSMIHNQFAMCCWDTVWNADRHNHVVVFWPAWSCCGKPGDWGYSQLQFDCMNT